MIVISHNSRDLLKLSLYATHNTIQLVIVLDFCVFMCIFLLVFVTPRLPVMCRVRR